MLRHVVMWKIADSSATTEEQKQTIAEDLALGLRGLVGKIPQIISLSVGPNCVDADGNWDLGLVVDVEDEAALQAYAQHPAHVDVVTRIREVVSDRAAIDFSI